jgi:hypothetical protein
MHTWFCAHLGDALTAWEPLGRIEDLFRAACTSAGNPDDMAVFVRYESEGRLHCEVTAYFSPAAAAVAREVQASPCARPPVQGLSLALGNPTSWGNLFPDRDG